MIYDGFSCDMTELRVGLVSIAYGNVRTIMSILLVYIKLAVDLV